ncbi:hypothetical protein Msi02_04930 [Microbispora siamensis]|uniref:Uncharacterized protein n=1 Tax=Microbispora siamensis TaxID=564413 RepID=A0ABQ4GE29_9ACTN|nr:hypothetical protein Msi02_04930 [Microbispora siamensis]
MAFRMRDPPAAPDVGERLVRVTKGFDAEDPTQWVEAERARFARRARGTRNSSQAQGTTSSGATR